MVLTNLRKMKLLIIFISLFYYVNSDCCPGTIIWYSLLDPSTDDCAAVPGGEGKMKIGVDVMNIHNSLDRRRPACRIEVCNDGQQHDGTYCGYGPCNMFGCNCDGGCREGDPLSMFMDRYKSIVRKARTTTFWENLV